VESTSAISASKTTNVIPLRSLRQKKKNESEGKEESRLENAWADKRATGTSRDGKATFLSKTAGTKSHGTRSIIPAHSSEIDSTESAKSTRTRPGEKGTAIIVSTKTRARLSANWANIKEKFDRVWSRTRFV